MTMKRALVSAGLAAAMAVTGAVAGVAATGPGDGQAKDPEAVREQASPTETAEPMYEAGVRRTAGKNRYATAVEIASAYGWERQNTTTVYIASGDDYPDALALGPSIQGSGPLLLVTRTRIPIETQRALTNLRPCYIDIVGGEGVINRAVFNSLKQYAQPNRCVG